MCVCVRLRTHTQLRDLGRAWLRRALTGSNNPGSVAAVTQPHLWRRRAARSAPPRDPLGRVCVCVCGSGGRARLPHLRAIRDQTRPERRSLLLARNQAGAAGGDFNRGHAAMQSSSFREPPIPALTPPRIPLRLPKDSRTCFTCNRGTNQFRD